MATAAQIKKQRARLVAVAKKRQRVAYSEVDAIVDLDVTNKRGDRRKIGRILAQIGRMELDAGRPFLPAVVVRKYPRRPGPGFFAEVRFQCPKYKQIKPDTKLHDAVLADVYEHWGLKKG